MNISTGDTEENCVFCGDILDILTQDFFSRKEKSIKTPPVEDVKVALFFDRSGYERASSSTWKQRECYCATLIQRAFYHHHKTSLERDTANGHGQVMS